MSIIPLIFDNEREVVKYVEVPIYSFYIQSDDLTHLIENFNMREYTLKIDGFELTMFDDHVNKILLNGYMGLCNLIFDARWPDSLRDTSGIEETQRILQRRVNYMLNFIKKTEYRSYNTFQPYYFEEK